MEFKVGDIFNLCPPVVGYDAARQNSDRQITAIIPMGMVSGSGNYWMWWKPVGRRGGGVSDYKNALKHWKKKQSCSKDVKQV